MRPSLRRSIGWVALLVGAIVALRLAANGDLSTPPIASLDGLTEWTDARAAPAAAMALVRFVAELAAWYLLGLTALHGLAAALRSGGIAALADALAAPGAARLVRAGLGLGLLASTAAGAATTDGGSGTPAATATATMRPMRDGDVAGTAWMVPLPDAPAHVPASTPAPSATGDRPTTWTVSPGESMWSIAEDALTEAHGLVPSDAEIDPYWRALIEVNRDRLADHDDPDLIHPGQVFELP